MDTSNLLIVLYTGSFFVRELSLQSSFFKLVLLYLPYNVYNILYNYKTFFQQPDCLYVCRLLSMLQPLTHEYNNTVFMHYDCIYEKFCPSVDPSYYIFNLQNRNTNFIAIHVHVRCLFLFLNRPPCNNDQSKQSEQSCIGLTR